MFAQIILSFNCVLQQPCDLPSFVLPTDLIHPVFHLKCQERIYWLGQTPAELLISSLWFIHPVSPSTAGNYSECGFHRLYFGWQFMKSYKTQALWYVHTAFPQHTELTIWWWMKTILLWQDFFLTNPGRLLFMSMFSSRCLQAERLVIFLRILPAVRKDRFLLFEKGEERMERKCYKVNL